VVERVGESVVLMVKPSTKVGNTEYPCREVVSVTLYENPWRLLMLLLLPPEDVALAPPSMVDTSMGGIISGSVASALAAMMDVTLTLELSGRDHRVQGRGVEMVPVIMLAGREAPAHWGIQPLPPASPQLTRHKDKGGSDGVIPIKVTLSKVVPRMLVVFERDARGLARRAVVIKIGSPSAATVAVATNAKFVGRSKPISSPEKVREEGEVSPWL